jgi:hypothetical protein
VEVQSWGQLRRIAVLDLSTENATILGLPDGRKFFVAFIRRAVTAQDQHTSITYSRYGSTDVIDLGGVDRVIGRIYDRKRWSIIDRNDEVEEATFSTPSGTV